MTITQARLKELAYYHPDTGQFISLIGPRNNKGRAGELLGGLTDDPPYLGAKFDGKLYLLHRLAWLYVHGEMPGIIDHRDGDRFNNRISNLRVASSSQNACNSRKKANNTSGVKGVSWIKSKSVWEVGLIYEGKRVHRKYFKDFDEACKDIREARERYHGEFANHG